MGKFEITPIDIGGYIFTNIFSDDNRGSFSKLFETDEFSAHELSLSISESFVSCSDKNVIRGMHFQLRNPQIKIVSVLFGKIYDVLVDLRKNSGTYGQWRGFYLSGENHRSIIVPRGFAHGFLSLSDKSTVLYQCDGRYDKESDTGIIYNDKDINVNWPIDLDDVIVGSRDKELMTFETFQNMDFINQVVCGGGNSLTIVSVILLCLCCRGVQ